MKRTLIDQAGGKCANPGCPNRLVELHHIHEWHVYQTHDAEHMIAICAACHDSVNRGQLQISDEALYRWKGIDRRSTTHVGHIYVEPGEAPRLLLGSITARGDSGLVVFESSEQQRLSFVVHGSEIMLLNLKISSPNGGLLLDVVEGYVRQQDPSIEYRIRPGAVEVPAGLDSPLVPGWVRASLLREDDRYGEQPLPLLALEVIDRGLVRVQGLWLDKFRGVVITRDRLSFVARGRPRPITIVGAGENTILNYAGPVDSALFGFADERENR